MKLILLLSLIAVSSLVLIQGNNAAADGLAEAEEVVAPGFISSDELEEEEETEPHLRVERSPGWRRRFRVRIRNPIRKIGRAVRKVGQGVKKVGRKVGQGIKKAASKVKSGVKRLASKTKAAIKKAGSKLKGAAKKAKDKVKSAIKRVKSHTKKVVKAPGDLAKKVRDKLKSLVIKGGEEEEIVEPEILPEDQLTTAKPICNSACQFIKNAVKEAIFFKQSFCAFYMVRRKHSDFLIDRNTNVTLAYMLNEVQKGSLSFYTTLAEVLQAENSTIVLESRQKVSRDCARGKLLTCTSDGVDMALRKLMCLRPCFGFEGCSQSDETLQKAIDQAVVAYDGAANRIVNLLSD